jgi:hypothetical protein
VALKSKLLLAFLYSLLFPIGMLLGEPYAGAGMVLSLPFLPGAWFGGVLMNGLIVSKWSYALGASLAIFAQLALILSFRHIRVHGLRPAT